MKLQDVQSYLMKYLGFSVTGAMALAWIIVTWIGGDKGVYAMAVLSSMAVGGLTHLLRKSTSTTSEGGSA